MSEATSEAAEVVLRERERQRAAEAARKKKARANGTTTTAAAGGGGGSGGGGGGGGGEGEDDIAPALETVSVPKWDGADAGDVDESELDRRQRALSEQLEQRQREVVRQGRQLAKVREELKALEAPIKAEIMQIRERLEDANRREIALVDTVNALRKDLHAKEKELRGVRDEKQTFADDLIRVMADYERRKTERLNEIAELVGDKPVGKKPPGKPAPANSFAGF